MEINDEISIPFQATHPGEILGEELKERGIKQKDFAARIGMQPSHLNDFIRGKRDLNSEMALKFEKQLGIPYRLWMNLQSGYEYDCRAIAERDKKEQESVEYEQACGEVINVRYLYKSLDISELTSAKRVNKLNDLFHFDLRSPDKIDQVMPGMYKHSKKLQIDYKNVRTWLLLNWLETSRSTVECEYVKGNAVKAAEDIARMANSQKMTVEDVKCCLNGYGIAYLFVKKIEKAPIDAFSTFANGHPCITVTYRRNDMDKLAFDILHELCHIDRHISDETPAFISIEGVDYTKDSKEKEANTFARQTLIPDGVWRRIMNVGCSKLTPYEIVKTIASEAEKHGISPSIAMARFRTETGWYRIPACRSPKIY